MKTSIFHRPSLLSVLTAAFTITGILISGFIISILYNDFKSELRAELKNRLVSITTVAALQQDGDALVEVSARDDEYYQMINERNLKIRLSDPDLIYVYTMRKDEQGIYFIVDANQPGDLGIADFGQRYEEPGPTLEENFDTMTRTIIEPDFYTDEFGTFLSAYAPIFTATGERIGVLGVDIDAKNIVAKERQFLNRSLVIFFASIPIIALAGYFLGRRLTNPLTELTNTVQKITAGNLDERAIEPTTSREVSLLASSFNSMTSQLHDLISSLERNVNERTLALTERTSQLEAIAGVARSIASIQEMNQLLPAITRLVSERFGFYHVGIFLLDDKHEFALLQAANSEGGARMLARGHRLRVGQQGIVGYVTSQGTARIALDVGEEAVFFNNPDLPETHSEVALPLKFGQEIIGALDIQSTEKSAFSQDDVELFSILADQVSVAIQNARSLEQAQQALREAEVASSQLIGQAWKGYSEVIRSRGYRYDGIKPEPLRKISANINEQDGISVPVQLRGQTIGRLKLKSPDSSRKWTDDELAIIESTAERVALAMDGARLLDEAQKRATRETFLSGLAAKLSTSFQMDSILRDTVEELGQALEGSTVTFQLVNPEKPPIIEEDSDSTRRKRAE